MIELYFMPFIDVETRNVYVTPIMYKYEKAQIIDGFISKFANKWGRAPEWLIIDKTGE